MCLKLAFLFIGIPFIEVLILIRLSGAIGFWPTVAIQVATGFAGAALARLQGMKTLSNIRQSLADGIMPAEELVDGLLILVSGLLLLTPGLLTDLFGFLLLIPWSRLLFKRYLRRRFDRMIRKGNTGIIYIR